MADTDRQSSREHGAPAGPIADLRDGPGSDPPTRLLAKMLADARYGRLALRLNRPISRDFPEADTRTRTGDPFITRDFLCHFQAAARSDLSPEIRFRKPNPWFNAQASFVTNGRDATGDVGGNVGGSGPPPTADDACAPARDDAAP